MHRMIGFGSILALLYATACGDDGNDSGGGAANDGGASSDGGASNDGASSSDGGSTSDGGSSSGGGTPDGSAGCGVALSEPTGAWNAKTLDVGGTTRDWFVYLPPNYDPTRPYTVVYQFHGCSDSPNRENNNVPIEGQSGEDAIIVRGRAVGTCWDTSGQGPDVAFFDAMVGAIEASYCANPERRMAAGYSSGAFMTHVLACVRGAELRGVASIAGAQAGSGCTGPVAALLIHDANDNVVDIGTSSGARDAYLAANGCDATTTAYQPKPCVSYDRCDAGLPVVWCETTMQFHDRQDALAGPAFWSFLSSL